MKPLVVFACLVTGTLLLVRLAPLPLPPPAPSTRIETVGDGFPLVLIDPTGRRTVLPSPPNRIASTTLGTDEILLELVDPSRLVTLSSIADDARYSSISERAPAVAGRVDRGVESILSHTPDLVLVATYTATETVDILLRTGLPTFRLGAFTSLSDIEQNIHTLARLVGRIERGQALVARMRHRLETVESALPPLSTRPKALFLTRGLSTAGSNTTVDEILRRAGAINLAARHGRRGWVQLSAEEILSWQPDVLIGQTESPRAIRGGSGPPGWRVLQTIRVPRILLPARTLTSVSHYVIEAVESLHQELHR